ncbi:MAG: dephospho-CoA kinase [Acidimicrobiales bacterium]
MKRIGVAGGIGAGKTAVTQHLLSLGWPVIDADEIARDVVRPGQPALLALRDAFGDAILDPDGALDRAFLADVVFHDVAALRRLNAITHGPIGVEILRRLEESTGPAAFVAIPLFRPEHREGLGLDDVWAVLVQPETAVARLVDYRGFSPEDATARLANQMSNAERTRIVDRVFWNEGSLDELFAQVDRALEEDGLARG